MRIPSGYTPVEEATEKWGRYRAWWYNQIKDGKLNGYSFPGLRGTYVKDKEVEEYIMTPQPKNKTAS